MGPRGDAIIEFDWSVGEVMKTLKRLGLEKNTIIVLSSDNGPVVDDGYKDQAVELLGNHQPAGRFRGGKYSSFEGGTRVPGILCWAGTIKPGVSDKLLCQIDMIATFARMLNVEVPVGAAPDSQNQLSSWLNKGGKGRECLVVQNAQNTLSIIMDRWKFIPSAPGNAIHPETKTELGNLDVDQLYNLSKDGGEKVNVAPQNPQVVNKLRSKIKQIINANKFSQNI